MSAPKKFKILLSQTLKRPIFGDNKNVHEMAKSRPGSASGISINPQVRFLHGMSVRSVRKAKHSAKATEIKVLAPASTAVLRKTT